MEIDVGKARSQHAAYVAALERAGFELIRAEPVDSAPDSVFVEDTAVVLGRRALLTRPGAPSRRAEVAGIRTCLRGQVYEMTGPATLDGGDVLRLGEWIFVGLSSRTNRQGFELLAAHAAEEGLTAVAVPMREGLHLKSACSRLGEAVLGHFDRVDPAPFRERGLTLIDAPDEMGANVLELGKHVLISAAAPKTAAMVGERAIVVDVGEFHKGDGALTCLSILME